MLKLSQYLALENAATVDANSPDVEWNAGDILYYVYRDGRPVLANPYEKEIKGGELFVGFTKSPIGDKHIANPVMNESRCVQQMGPDQDSAFAYMIEGDYISMHSLRLLGYYLDAGQILTSNEGAKLRIIAFGHIGGLVNDTWLNDLAPAALEIVGEDRMIVTSIGPWLRTNGVRTAV